jgi:hypothetical protein
MCEIVGRIYLWLFQSVSFSNWIEILKLLGAAAAFWIGLNQYRKSEAWKRLEFVAAEMKAFLRRRCREIGDAYAGLAQKEGCALQVPGRERL